MQACASRKATRHIILKQQWIRHDIASEQLLCARHMFPFYVAISDIAHVIPLWSGAMSDTRIRNNVCLRAF